MNAETVSQFFSTGAQSAAAITALSGTFAIIRAQNLTTELERRAKVAYHEYSHFPLLTKVIDRADTENLIEAPTFAEKLNYLIHKFRTVLGVGDSAPQLEKLLAEAKISTGPDELQNAMMRWRTWERLVHRYEKTKSGGAFMRRSTVMTTILGALAVFSGVVGTGLPELAAEPWWALAMDSYLCLLGLCLASSVQAVRVTFRAE